jgi:pimeloyl-ACP methyl ester carboxylesterase
VAEALHRGIPGSRFEEMPGIGHVVNLEDVGAFDAAVRGFLGTLPDE